MDTARERKETMSGKHIGSVVSGSPAFCTGCTACVHACPASALSMQEDDEGFPSPMVDENLCIQCGLCRKVCPVCSFSLINGFKNPVCFAALAPDKLREKSTSGAAFPVLAQEILNRGGLVCGAAFRRDWSVAHILVEDAEGLEKLKRSKYVQSDLADCLPAVKKMLDGGLPVLFSGTGCQVAGLKGFLRKDYPNLFTADIICHGVPSPGVWRRWLEENFDVSAIGSISFRGESVWGEEAALVVKDRSGQTLHRETYSRGTWYRGFSKNLFLRKSCGQCLFNRLPRQGDFTLGDYWGIDAVSPELNDGRGTSLLLVNTEKGQSLLKQSRPAFKILKKLPLKSALRGNLNISSPSPEHEHRAGFFALARKTTVTEALRFAASDVSDCKIVNFWFALNYGAMLTCYALQEALFLLGKSAMVINYMPEDRRIDRAGSCADIFSRKYLYLTEPIHTRRELFALNNVTETFITGSDQIFRWSLMKDHGGSVYLLDFVHADKRRIACSASFGTLEFEGPPEEFLRFQYNLKQFDAVSVRENTGIRILKNMGVDAVQIIEPVFCLPKERWHALADGHSHTHGEGILCYLLDSQPEVKDAPVLAFISERLGVPVSIQKFDRQRSVEDWLDSIRRASFVITDSFHGMCFALLFHRPFAVLASYGKARGRMDEILGKLGLQERILAPDESERLDALFTPPIDWDAVDAVIEKERNRMLSWLKEKLNAPVRSRDSVADRLNYLQSTVEEQSRDMALLYNRFRILRKYYGYKLLFRISYGRKKTRYLNKLALWHERVRRLRALKKKMRQGL